MRPRLPARLVDWFPPAFIALAGAAPPSHGLGTRLFALAMAAPLLLRRRHPLGVFAAIALIALAQLIVGARSFGDAALLVALYTVAATQPGERLVAAAVVTEIGIVLAVAQWAGGRWPEGLAALNAMAIAATVIGVNIHSRRALVESLRDRAARLELERDQQGRLAAAAERARIAREMHDIVAHNLSVMIALADGAAYALADAPERAEAAIHDVARTGRGALTEMRRLLGVLREGGAADTGVDTGAGTEPALAPQPGIADLESLLAQVRAAGLPAAFVQEGESADALPEGLQLTAYRIVQEALTNTLKHGGPAATAEVRLQIGDGAVEIDVRDSGRGTGTGLDGASAGGAAAEDGGASGEGGGLRGMRERAALYGGSVQAGPLPGGGWQVRASLRVPTAVLP